MAKIRLPRCPSSSAEFSAGQAAPLGQSYDLGLPARRLRPKLRRQPDRWLRRDAGFHAGERATAASRSTDGRIVSNPSEKSIVEKASLMRLLQDAERYDGLKFSAIRFRNVERESAVWISQCQGIRISRHCGQSASPNPMATCRRSRIVSERARLEHRQPPEIPSAARIGRH